MINEDVAERSAGVRPAASSLQGEPPKSAVFVPLLVGGGATGRISLQNLDREHAFSDADVRLLTTLAGSLSVALENARLFDETAPARAPSWRRERRCWPGAVLRRIERGDLLRADTSAVYLEERARIGTAHVARARPSRRG